MTPNCITVGPRIRRLTIERFRGIEHLDWYPEAGVNIILGGGDVGKSTVLDAIGLLLHPTNTTVLTDADHWRRDVKNGFSQAVMSLPDSCEINQQTKHVWPWEWDGKEAKLPAIDRDPATTNDAEAVFACVFAQMSSISLMKSCSLTEQQTIYR